MASKLNLSFLNRITVKDKALFTRSLSAMIGAGLPLVKALGLLAAQTTNKRFAAVIKNVVTRLEEGESIADAFSHQGGVFDPVYIASIRAAESSGKFEQILQDLSEQQEREYKLASGIRAAISYPIFIVAVMIVAAGVLLVTVVPKLEGLFVEMEMQLPLSTRMLIAVSNFLINYWYIIVLILGGGAYAIRYYLKTEQGKFFYSKTIIRTPIVKELFISAYMARFARTFGILGGAGVPIVQSVRLLAGVMNNVIFERALLGAVEKIQKGVPLSTSLVEENCFHPLVIQMIEVGEHTGKMDETMFSLARFFDDETSKKITSAMSLLEPILLIIIGAGVATIVFSVIIPIYQLTGGVE
ncbi:MAG: type II secretion system F family protein [Candidatus Berkelbacteria bacterium]|nr:type II secretion system F family protein [Candidatus Berkelbacteria bacterium]